MNARTRSTSLGFFLGFVFGDDPDHRLCRRRPDMHPAVGPLGPDPVDEDEIFGAKQLFRFGDDRVDLERRAIDLFLDDMVLGISLTSPDIVFP